LYYGSIVDAPLFAVLSQVGNGGAEAIAELIRSGRSTITCWYIAGNRIDAEGLRHVCGALATDSQVDMLWLKRNPLRLGGARVLAAMLATNRALHTLDLDNTGLLDVGALVVIHEGLARNGGALKHLYLSGNGLGLPTAEALADCLAGQTTAGGKTAAGGSPATPGACALLSLSAGSNRFGDAGAGALARGLALNATLTRLSLPSNRIGPAGAAALACAVRAHGSLASLNLGFAKNTAALGELGNAIGDEGALSLAGALRTNQSLRELDLTHNGLTQRGVDHLMAALRGQGQGVEVEGGAAASSRENRTLVTLRTASWGLTRNDVGADELALLLERNLARCDAGALAAVAEAHMPAHVRDIYSVYRVA
jgi:Ran GTPase-activating protein (RanGAP) involved in mRNA processing and transport